MSALRADAAMPLAHPRQPPARALAPRRPFVILAICCLSLFLVTMDLTIVNVALPSIRRDLHASVAGLQWSVDGYTVVVASFLMLSGSMADRFGRRRMFQTGLAVFSVGSLLCSLAPTTNALVSFRMLQALGGSMLNPIAMSIIVNTFTDPKERARAIGVWGAIFGVSMAVGPLLGGALVDSIGWRSIFWVNVPVGVLAIALTARFVPESRAERPRRFDLAAQALIVVGLLALTSAVIDGRRVGWSSWEIAAGLGVALTCGVALVVWESRRAEPLLDLRFFQSLSFSSATVLAMLSFAAFSGFLFLNALYLQEARGLHASAAGLMTLPIALALVVCSPLSGRLVGAGYVRLAIVISGAGISCGALILTGLANDTPLSVLVAAYAIFGVGLGSIGAPVNTTAVSGMPRSQAGLAAAVASTSRQVGASLGVALAGSLAGGGIESAHRVNLAASTHPVFWVIAAFGVAIVGLGIVSTGARARKSAERIAFLLGNPNVASPAAPSPSPRPGSDSKKTSRRRRRVFALLLFVMVSIPALAIGFGGPSKPPPMTSISAPFKHVDFSDLPPLAHFRARDGASLAFRAYHGSGDGPKGSVFLVHGSSASSSSMHVLARAMAAAGFNAYALDVRGHGESGARGAIGYIGQLEDDLEDFVASVHPARPVTLAGFSSGGGFALRFAGSSRQRLFSNYLLLSPFIGRKSPTYRPDAGGWIQVGVPRLIALEMLNAIGVTACNDLPVVRFAVGPESQNTLTNQYSFALALNFQPQADYRANIRALARPVRLVAGADDEVFRSDRFAAVFEAEGKTVPVTLLPGVGHVALTLDPSAVQLVVQQVRIMDGS